MNFIITWSIQLVVHHCYRKVDLKLYVSTSYGGIGLESSTCLKSFQKTMKGFKIWRIFIKIAIKHSIKFEILIRIMLHSNLISSVHDCNTFAITIVFFYFPMCHTSTYYTHYVDLHYLLPYIFSFIPTRYIADKWQISTHIVTIWIWSMLITYRYTYW
jgi:hypothetical protein